MSKSRITRMVLADVHASDPSTALDRLFLFNADGTPVTPGQLGGAGTPGKDGKSSYQVWLDAGNTGDVNTYLASLKGPKGDPGVKGDPGTQGIPGTNPRGPWTSAMDVVKRDVVSYLTGSYLALNDIPAGGAAPPLDPTNWMQIASGGGELAYAEMTASWNITGAGPLTANQFVDIPGLSIVVPAGSPPYKVRTLLSSVQLTFGAAATGTTTGDVHAALVDETNTLLSQAVWRTHAVGASGSAFATLAVERRMPSPTVDKTIRVQLGTSMTANVSGIIVWAAAGNVTPQAINNMGPVFIEALAR